MAKEISRNKWLKFKYMRVLIESCSTYYIKAEANGQHFADNIYQCIFSNENFGIFIRFQNKFLVV